MHGTTVLTLDRDISCFRKIHKSYFPWRHTLVHASQGKPLTAYYYWHSLATVFLIAAAAAAAKSLQSCPQEPQGSSPFLIPIAAPCIVGRGESGLVLCAGMDLRLPLELFTG